MRNKLRDKKRKKLHATASGIIRFALLSCAAIATGMLLGNIFGSLNISALLQRVDTESYESILGGSMPVIDTVYNSGNESVSISGEIKDLIKAVFSFDLDNPVSILNSQSALLYSYHDTLPFQANNTVNGEDLANTVPGNTAGSQTEPGETQTPDNTAQGDNHTGGPEGVASSISSTEEDVEKKDPDNSEIVKDGKLTIQNGTKYTVNIPNLLKEALKFKFDKKKDKVLVFHTHTSESYINNLSQLNTSLLTRTRDPRYSVVRVGEELSENLRKKYGMQVIHNATVHDYPDYNSSYSNSLKTISAIQKAYPNIKIIIDLHRDAFANDKKLRLVADVNGKKAAKVSFIVATGELKQNHPTWRENLKLALKIQEKLLEECPQITQPIQLSEYTYNQHLSNGSLLIEVGGDGNFMSECLESTKYLAKAINDVVSK